MIASITVFARREKQADWHHAVWALHSVSHGNHDISFSLPEPLSDLKLLLHKQLTTPINSSQYAPP